MIARTRFLWIAAALLGTLNGGCGESGSRPTLYPEVQFQVQPAGQSTFTVGELVAGGVRHTFPADMVFTATAPVFFFLENAPPPYSGTFTLKEGGDITVTVSVSPGGIPSATDTTSGPESTVTVSAAVSPGATPTTPSPATEEIRFDVCVPSLTPGTCFTGGDEGTPGIQFSGTLGDASLTYETVGITPTIYFFEGAQDSINANLRLVQVTGNDRLVVQLFINGALEQTDSSSSSDGVHMRQDL